MMKATYDKLITPNGQPQYGRFNQAFTEINYKDFDYRTTMDKPANGLQRHFHFNQFHFIGLHSQSYTLACAIANVRYVANAFVYLYNHETGQMHRHSFIQPLGLRCQQSNKPFSGLSRFSKGSARFEILGRNQPNRYHLDISIGKDIRVDATLTQMPQQQPVTLCTRTGYNGWAYTQKHTNLATEGFIQWHKDSIALEATVFSGSSDWSCGYMRRETAWNWACLSATLPDQTPLGLNLACGVNETSFTENTLWLNGIPQALDNAQFTFNRRKRMEPWQITTSDQRVELTFVPEACHHEQINAYLIASNFSQLPGKYYGTVRGEDGTAFRLEGINGLVEDHYAKW